MKHYYTGVWLEKSAPTADFIVALPNLKKNAMGCYWIEATPKWGIKADTSHVARVTDPNLDGGILIAVALTKKDLNNGNNSWVWIKKDGLSQTHFSEMWFNRRTKGIER